MSDQLATLKRDIQAMIIAENTKDYRSIERLAKSAQNTLITIRQWARSQRWNAEG
jgi:hypothetical protein